jgi:transposase-like protein
MTQRKVVPKEIKNEILAKVKGGEKVVDLARQYGISDKSIYTWLHQGTGDQVVSICKTIPKKVVENCLHKMDT